MYCGLCIVLVVFSALLVQGQDPAPNIVFIISDDQGYHDVGYHGAEIVTPNMDALAATGVRLENYYVQPVCSPSRSVLLSGKYQIHTGLQGIVNREVGGLPIELTTLPEMMQKSGYATHMVGKHHLGYSHKEYTPSYRGFDTFYGFYQGTMDFYDHCHAAEGSQTCCKDLHFDTKEDMTLVETEGYATTLFRDRAITVIKEHNQEQPLFLYVAFNAPHFPLQAPQEYLDMYTFIQDEDRRTYAAMMTAMDDSIGNITESLREAGLWQNAILIFTSDNGGASGVGGFNNPLRGEKGGYYEGGLRAVSFVNSPLLLKTVVISNELLHISDWYPTLVHLAGGDTTGMGLDGFDIWNTLSEGEASPRKEILHNIYNEGPLLGQNHYPDIFDVRVQAAVRVGDYKLITGRPGGRDQGWPEPPPYDHEPEHWRSKRQPNQQNIRLYNIAEDPEERNDLSEPEEPLVIEMLHILAAYNTTYVPDQDLQPAEVSCDATGGAAVPWL